MMTTKQKVAIGALIPLCGAVWAPSILEQFQGEETKSQVSADVSMGADMGSMDPGMPGPGPGMDMDMGGSPDPMASAQPSSPGGAAPSMDMGSMDTGMGGSSPSSGSVGEPGPAAVLEEVLSALEGADAFRPSQPLNTGTQFVNGGFGAETPILGMVGESYGGQKSPLDTFVEDNPLRGTLTGEDTQYALMGSHRLTVGDEIPGMDAEVAAITRGQIVIRVGEDEQIIDLPPLKTDPSRARKRNSNGLDGGADDPTGVSSGPDDTSNDTESL